MPELRKRPAPKETATPAPVAKRSASKPRAGANPTTTAGKVKKVAARVKDAVVGGGSGDVSTEQQQGEVSTAAATTSASTTTAATQPVDEVSTVGEIPETVGAGTTGAEEGGGASVADEMVVGGGESKSEGVSAATAAVSTGAGVGGISGPLGQESVGKQIGLEGFGGTIKTHSGNDVTLAELLSKSEKGVVLFTYPKASTPGCTTQACLFRDSYAPLQAAGLSVYGLSTDSPKANTTFATKQRLPFDLLCDPDAGLTGALGLKKSPGKGTLRGSVVISKEGVVEVWNQAGPAKTLEAVTQWIDGKK